MRQIYIIVSLIVIGAIIIGFAKSLADAERRQDELKQGEQNPPHQSP